MSDFVAAEMDDFVKSGVFFVDRFQMRNHDFQKVPSRLLARSHHVVVEKLHARNVENGREIQNSFLLIIKCLNLEWPPAEQRRSP